ncbi:hypothetical protein ACVIIV_005574 [Bradyrhizobium sp. USDA 4354]
MENVRVLSTLGLMGAMRSLSSSFEATSGIHVDADFAPTLALLKRLREGEAADLVILTREGLDEMIGERRVVAGSAADLARSFVGIAMRAGQVHPDLANEAALRQTLLAARSVAYSRLGASGVYFAQLIVRMGIATEINAKATIVEQGFYGRAACDRRGGPRRAADQRAEAGRRHRGGRPDSARIADAGRILRRLLDERETCRRRGSVAALSGIARGRPRPAPVGT